jgi:hypothetical protein
MHWRWKCDWPGFEVTGEFTAEGKPGLDRFSIIGVTGEANSIT